jgi:hypothetical protein
MKIFAFIVLIIGLMFITLSARAVAGRHVKKPGKVRRVATIVLALFLSLFGVMLAWLGLRVFVPQSFGVVCEVCLVAACCMASAALPILRIKTARSATPGVAVPSPQPGSQGSESNRWPDPGLPAGIASIRAQREMRATKLMKVALACSIICACLCGVKNGPVFGGIIGLWVLAFIWQWHMPVGRISEIEYRTLPGSTDAAGQHRCVYCGKRGIYRRGAYASNSTWHECTGCRKHLFVD